MNDIQVIGSGLLVFGILFFIFGIFTFGSRQFLVTANLLLLVAFNLLFGVKEFVLFIFQRTKIVGTLAFLIGISLVFLRLPFPGILCEIVGAYWLFGGFTGMILSYLSRIPFLSYIIPSSWRKENLDL